MADKGYDLAGKRIIVTGSSRGIGRAIALICACAGADVVVNYHKNIDAAADIVCKIENLGTRARAIQADVAKSADVKRLFDEAVHFLGGIDAVAISAGIASRAVYVRETPDDEIERVFSVDLLGAYYCAREAAKHMHPQKSGLIAMISSVAAKTCGPKMGPYGVSKAALEGLKDILAKEEAASSIRVNNILPGLVNTDMGRQFLKPYGIEEVRSIGEILPMGRVCEPEDIGHLFAFLASDEGSYITGQSIMIEGGMTLVEGLMK